MCRVCLKHSLVGHGRSTQELCILCAFFDSLIDPAGWLEWNEDFALRTLYYGEYRNVGPGSWTERRVRWDGYRVITSVKNFIKGESWLPSTHVPFKSGI